MKKIPKRLRPYAKNHPKEKPADQASEPTNEPSAPSKEPSKPSKRSKEPKEPKEPSKELSTGANVPSASIACHADPRDRVDPKELKEAETASAKPSNDKTKEEQKAEAKRKRFQKAKIAAQKLHANIPAGAIYAELCVPGPELTAVSYTLYPCPGAEEYKPFTSPIGVILYTETFYVNDIKDVPKPLDQFIQKKDKKGCSIAWNKFPTILDAWQTAKCVAGWIRESDDTFEQVFRMLSVSNGVPVQEVYSRN